MTWEWVNNALNHSRAYGCVYRIPVEKVDGKVQDAILTLLEKRIVALSRVNGCYELFQYQDCDIWSRVDFDIPEDSNDGRLINQKIPEEYRDEKYYNTVALKDYLSVPELGEAVEEVLDWSATEPQYFRMLLVMGMPNKVSIVYSRF